MILARYALLFSDVLLLSKNGFLSTFVTVNEFLYASA
jgi:hypothetical protein